MRRPPPLAGSRPAPPPSCTLAALLLTAAVAAQEPADTGPGGAALFEEQVLPLLERRCFECHGPGSRRRGGLALTSAAAVRAGGDRGPAVDRGAPADSLLLAMVSYADEAHRMPPSGRLPEEERALLARWVAAGLPWSPGVELEEPERADDGPRGRDDGMRGWALQPVTRPAPPAVGDAAWVTNPIDAFVLARLEAAGLAPSPEADRRTLIRRATYDLTGLPPSPAEVEAFLADDAPGAWGRLVERLLASPHFGEHWGRKWLDVVRYAETNGYERDADKPYMWRYRDWVIDAFDADLPYDEFVRQQLAGDELQEVTPASITATGFTRLMTWDDEPPTGRLQARYDVLDDLVRTTGEAFLGTTLGCARCHDHKGDPISQEDYYSFMAFFHGLTEVRAEGNLVPIPTPGERAAHEAALVAHEAELGTVAAELAELEQAYRRAVEGDAPARADEAGADLARRIAADGEAQLGAERFARWQALRRRREELQRRAPQPPRANAATEAGPHPDPLFVHVRGNAQVPGAPVEPRFPECFGDPEPRIPDPGTGAATSGRRRFLAEWIASADNPLTARVQANRLWQHLLRRGIVPTPNDFGELGERPTHPALLDWLASELVARGWSVKETLRLILASSTYRQAYRPAGSREADVDPANDLLWRARPRRLTAEELRDSVLCLTGRLNPARGGPPFYEPLPAAALATSSRPGAVWGTSPEAQTYRRSVYIKVKRSLRTPILEAFDLADTDSPCPVRFTTTQPGQALALLNSEFAHRHAAGFAARLAQEAGDDPGAQVRLAVRLALAREASADEVAEHLAFLAELERDFGLDRAAALGQLCLLVMNLNEFVYLD